MEAPRGLKIAIFSELPLTATNGIVTTVRNIVEGLVQKDERVMIVSPYAKDLPETYYGAKVISSRSIRNPLYPDMTMGVPKLNRKTRKELTEFDPDIVHVVNPFIFGRTGIRYAKRRGIPLVESYHTHLAPYTRSYHAGLLEEPVWRYMRRIHNRADVNFVVSSEVQDELHTRGFRNLESWVPGVDTKLFHPEKQNNGTREMLTEGHPERAILLSVGRLAPEKRLEILAPAVQELVAQGKDIHLSLVGAGSDEDHLRTLFKGLPVTFTGSLFGEDLARAYCSSDIFLMPSTTETVGLVVLEAMASGIPVVASNARGIPNFLENGEQGYLVEPADPHAFALAVSSLLENPELREQFGIKGRRKAESLSWEKATEKVIYVYRQLATRR